MVSDPSYAEAVLRLRTRKCTEEDVKLFNSRVLQSPNQLLGDKLDATHIENATMIVTTNVEREFLSNQKAYSLVQPNDPSNFSRSCPIFAAVDKMDGHVIENLTHRKKILEMEIGSSSQEDKCLPAKLPLFIGMKVILRKNNLSTDLKITNGSEGEVVDILSHIDVCGFKCLDLVLVKFFDSPAKLSFLDKGVFPIKPLSTRFSITFEHGTKMITRYQVPLQLASCTTGHFAQGKTLKAVIVNLTRGSHCAYVAASRPNSRNGLYITKPVTLDDLNKPLKQELAAECLRLDKIARDTIREYIIKNPIYHSTVNRNMTPEKHPNDSHNDSHTDSSRPNKRGRFT